MRQQAADAEAFSSQQKSLIVPPQESLSQHPPGPQLYFFGGWDFQGKMIEIVCFHDFSFSNAPESERQIHGFSMSFPLVHDGGRSGHFSTFDMTVLRTSSFLDQG